MSSSHVDFVTGFAQSSQDKTEEDFSLCYAYPVIDDDRDTSEVLTRSKRATRASDDKRSSVEDGLYVSENPFTNKLVKPYRLDDVKPLDYESLPRFRGKLVEIAVRDVRVHAPREENPSAGTTTTTTPEIVSVSLLFRGKSIFTASSPFNRKLYKVLMRNSERHDLSIQVHARHGTSSVLPLPLPQRSVRDHKVEMDFAIGGDSGRIYAGTVVCTVSLSTYGSSSSSSEPEPEESVACLYRPSNDPNDPQNSLSLSRPHRRSIASKKDVKYFLLTDPALIFDVADVGASIRKASPRESKPPDIVVAEQSAFSLLDISLKNLFQASRPLRPSSSNRRHHTIGRTILAVTVLRGVEVPVREESALVTPLLEVEWGNVVHTTATAEGPAPVWQQTMHFELPRQNGEHCVKFRLFDQHPVWGRQWLGEARIPLESHRNYQELERWIALSPLFSPVLSFGYVQASPGRSHTRIYVLMKMEQPGNAKTLEANALDTLLKGLQRCLATPYRIAGVETPDDAARLTMLLPSLPMHYGPVPPRQALNVNKVDHYGRAALLATLLQGLGLRSYVLLGSSQISRWTAFVLSIEENDVVLWDPEIGDRHKLSDSRCSLMKVSRLINHSGIWENMQKSVLPHNLRYNVAVSKDWRPLVPVVPTSTSSRSIQTMEPTVLQIPEEDAQEKEGAPEVEQYLRDKLSGWRSALGLTTIFNRHAVSVLRNFVSDIPSDVTRQVDKRDLKQLYRAYHTHGFLLNLRQTAPDELAEQIAATKIQNITGPVEFALVCHVQRYVGKTCSIWLALAILRSRG
ncbi:PREDICTED: coiled-coil and C2 domain-containing protein 2A-like [Wasmannia auropunctata]|uniref:coiled-coil and C2 domain-containing protein 2A-like n=1 Tax=Wasmannia auropunctata TaxID=64793 RepID=UPI0005EFF015|nr:PREDICTED: coiled-coil and C2 domain-containing protein 2A-like [Wasmannia auropunctata]